jgi:hypothetical protein
MRKCLQAQYSFVLAYDFTPGKKSLKPPESELQCDKKSPTQKKNDKGLPRFTFPCRSQNLIPLKVSHIHYFSSLEQVEEEMFRSQDQKTLSNSRAKVPVGFKRVSKRQRFPIKAIEND